MPCFYCVSAHGSRVTLHLHCMSHQIIFNLLRKKIITGKYMLLGGGALSGVLAWITRTYHRQIWERRRFRE